MNKILQFSIFILLFIVVGIFVSGTTTITDNQITTNGSINASSLVNFLAGINLDESDIINYISINTLSDGIIAHFSMEDSNSISQLMFDSSGKNNYGYLGSTTSGDSREPSYTTGVQGQALEFNSANNDFARVTGNATYLGIGQTTVCLWFKTNNKSEVRQEFFMAQRELVSPNRFYMNKENNGDIRFTLGSTSTDIKTSAQYSDNTWYHYCVVRDQTNGRGLAYWNGDLVSNVSVTIGATPLTTTLTIGTDETGKTLNGAIDDVYIFNGSLSSLEIKTLYRGFGEQTNGNDGLGNIEKVYYVRNNGTDIVNQIHSAIASGNTNIIVPEPATYSTPNTLVLNLSNLIIDFTKITYQYTGTGDTILLQGSSSMLFEFNRITINNTATAGFDVISCGSCRINGRRMDTNGAGSNYGDAVLLLNNGTGGGSENVWTIDTITGNYLTKHGIHIKDNAVSYEGDKFESKWIFGFTNTSIQVGDDGTGDNEYFLFDVAMDNYPNATATYVETWNDKSTYILKETVPGGGITQDIWFRSTAQNNIVMSPMSSFVYKDDGGNNAIIAPTAFIPFLNVGTLNVTNITLNNGLSVSTLTDGLISYYGLEECYLTSNNQTIYDSSGNNAEGILGNLTIGDINEPKCIKGRIGNAYQFNGINSYINITNTNLYNFSNTNFSISFWIKAGVSTDSPARIFYKRMGNSGLIIQTITNQYQFLIGSGTSIPSTVLFPRVVNSWDHIVVIYSNPKYKLYVNGISNISSSLVYNDSNTYFTIGGDYDTSSFNGTIDEIRIYNRSLNDNEIVSLYQGYGKQADAHIDNLQKVNDEIPQTNAIYNLGSSLLRWLKGWFINLDVSGNATIHNLNIDNSINMSYTNITNLNVINYGNSTNSNVWRTYVNASGSLITEFIG